MHIIINVESLVTHCNVRNLPSSSMMTISLVGGLMVIEGSLMIRLSEYLSTASSATSSSMIEKEMLAGKEVSSSFTLVPEVLTVDGCAPGPGSR